MIPSAFPCPVYDCGKEMVFHTTDHISGEEIEDEPVEDYRCTNGHRLWISPTTARTTDMEPFPYTFCPADDCGCEPQLLGADVLLINGEQAGKPVLHHRCADEHEFWIHEQADQRWALVRATTSPEQLARLGGEEELPGDRAPAQGLKCPVECCPEFTYLEGVTEIEGDEGELHDILPALKYKCARGHLVYIHTPELGTPPQEEMTS
ncbi:MAG TPA: hypothetical protein VGB92_26025 [Longimicrobium sp.]|jgi:hypothetical protein